MWVFTGLSLILQAAGTPVGIGVAFFAFLASCLVRVLSRSNWSRIVYRVISFGILFYLGAWTAATGNPEWSARSGNDMFLATLFAFFVGLPFSVGWLSGWPVAVCLQLALSEPPPKKKNRSPPRRTHTPISPHATRRLQRVRGHLTATPPLLLNPRENLSEPPAGREHTPPKSPQTPPLVAWNGGLRLRIIRPTFASP